MIRISERRIFQNHWNYEQMDVGGYQANIRICKPTTKCQQYEIVDWSEAAVPADMLQVQCAVCTKWGIMASFCSKGYSTQSNGSRDGFTVIDIYHEGLLFTLTLSRFIQHKASISKLCDKFAEHIFATAQGRLAEGDESDYGVDTELVFDTDEQDWDESVGV